MSYAIVVRNEALYGGLVVPRVRPSFKVSNSDLIEFLKDRLRDRGAAAQPMYTVYVPDPAGNYNAMVCYEYAEPGDVPVGDLLVRVPKGVYARFEPNGDYHDPVEDVWAQVDDATASAEITRAYREEIEVWRGPDAVELFISILV
ncbi:Predicted transcriptional regulator YdeE, contains AraC-type DNA-binding domain [Nocardia amikacinitolerans]|uniref:Predicted transcriptional regulator YdeE, contains AraC-type DNA-binding domain n=1 Tax=Nocardia amikacinitolerans TaxID=756689 RepID=A0A285L926_9NOCA|nr:GyrI-like domain-containing protein [Nocardia amikacinitolerans]MCP2275185.1 putative transcriptional regulator YdeE, contains AraC-type DNA-binding domain [Nocardia amikacinitolerans]MCP2296076.1 putative transcriptional regulator YdeE, contains AraC-type DNA-binding domain [Nocardia amikacinitolerans]SNY80973.1 Predicted transcriptional regulator YdeE, contains AraC-type DNA-binding domain [Nocardia amikacinitolerans]